MAFVLNKLPHLGNPEGVVTPQEHLDQSCKTEVIYNANVEKQNAINDALQNQDFTSCLQNATLASVTATGSDVITPTGWICDAALANNYSDDKNPFWSKYNSADTVTMYQYVYPKSNETGFVVTLDAELLNYAAFPAEVTLTLSREGPPPTWEEVSTQTETKSQAANVGSNTNVRLSVGDKTDPSIANINQRFKVTITLKNVAITRVNASESKEELSYVRKDEGPVYHYADSSANATNVAATSWIKEHDIIIRTDENKYYRWTGSAFQEMVATASGGNADTVDNQHASAFESAGAVTAHAALTTGVHGVGTGAVAIIDAVTEYQGNFSPAPTAVGRFGFSNTQKLLIAETVVP